MGPNASESLGKLVKTSKNFAKTSKNFAKFFVKTFVTAQYTGGTCVRTKNDLSKNALVIYISVQVFIL